MSLSPTDIAANGSKTSGVVTYTILVNGEAVPYTVGIYSIDIWAELNRIPRATVVVLDGSAAQETFKISESDWFVPGNEIEIELGYDSDETAIFRGVITGQSIKVRSSGNSMLKVECADPAIKMTLNPCSRYFYESSESEIFEAIIGRYEALSAEVAPTGYVHTELLQYQSTDWDFILTRADVNGMFCRVESGIIFIGEPDFSQEPAVEVTYGRNLLEVDAEMDAISQRNSVGSTSWDFSKTESMETTISSDESISPGNMSSADLASAIDSGESVMRAGAKLPAEILERWAGAKHTRRSLSKIRGRAKMRGLPAIKPDSVVKLNGLGERFNGSAYVSGVKHQYHKGEWLMDVQFGLSSDWFSEQFRISEKPAAGMGPSVSGLQAGLVTQIEADPDGDDRLLVRLPMIDTQEQGVWARLATPGAGNNRGVVIRPEIDDEVIVGFVHGDPNQPVILGALHSANNPSPIAASDDNHEKGWVTRSEIKMLINEDAPSVKIEMPSGKKVTIDDDAGEIVLADENGNSYSMSSDGIVMESAAEIVIKAAGNMTMEGANINVKANAGFKAEGSASAEISSSGSTAVKGGIVQIN